VLRFPLFRFWLDEFHYFGFVACPANGGMLETFLEMQIVSIFQSCLINPMSNKLMISEVVILATWDFWGKSKIWSKKKPGLEKTWL